MSNVQTERAKERVQVFETLLSSPGMNETCKIMLNPSRQAILLLNRLIEYGLDKGGEETGDEFLSLLPSESLSEIRDIAGEMLKKGGLVEFYQRLKLL